ncbi:MAG: DUF1343 domain-containing protein [Ginsengibacter sp.]
MNKVLFGIDQFCGYGDRYKSIRIGLVTNDAASNAFGLKSRVALINAGFKIVKLFSPEHGLSANAADGAFVPDHTDEITNLPVVSLYADKLKPTAKDLEDIDAIVFDIPDIGCRFYTYLWTMTYMMEACAEYLKKFILLDRANPLSGNLAMAEGPFLGVNCTSFLGRWSIPIRHSCTQGELANYFVSSHIPNLDLEVVKMKEWNRNDFPGKENWDFTPTSPAIKDAATALLYPGICLLEGINVNEGRGTEMDFKIFGAPWINASSLKDNLEKLNLPGIYFSTTWYIPNWGLYQGEVCFGLQLQITNEQTIRPVSAGIEILKQLIKNYPITCEERLYKTNANPDGIEHLDKLLGIQNAYRTIKNNIPIETQIPNELWQDIISPYLF